MSGFGLALELELGSYIGELGAREVSWQYYWGCGWVTGWDWAWRGVFGGYAIGGVNDC